MIPRSGITEKELMARVDQLIERCEGQGQLLESFCVEKDIDVRIVALAIGSQCSSRMQLLVLQDLIELAADLADKGERRIFKKTRKRG